MYDALTPPPSTTEAGLVEAIAGRRDELVDLAASLIALDTTAAPGEPAREEVALQSLLAARLRDAGLEVDVWEPSPESLPRNRMRLDARYDFRGRPQLLARRRGSGGGPALLLNGHVDVVPGAPLERWTSDPFRPEVREGLLYGRGACDMKGGVAAMVLAAETLSRLDVRLAGDLIVNTVTEEESTGAGSVATVARGVAAGGGLIPEPTGLRAWLGCRGSLLGTVAVDGRAGHAGLTQHDHSEGGAVNAIEKLAIVLGALQRLREEWRTRPDARHPHLLPGGIVPTAVAAGEWLVSYPASASLRFHVQYGPGQADGGGWGTVVEREIERCVAAAAETDSWLRIHPPRVTWSGDSPAHVVDPGEPVARIAMGVAADLGGHAGPAVRTTFFDAPTFSRAGIPTIGIGPGSIDVAHAPDEHVAIDDLVRAAQVLAVTAVRFCGTA
jgi:acetylornithine deacetylase